MFIAAGVKRENYSMLQQNGQFNHDKTVGVGHRPERITID